MQITYPEAVVICELFLISHSEGLGATKPSIEYKLISNIFRNFPNIINEEFYEVLCWHLKK